MSGDTPEERSAAGERGAGQAATQPPSGDTTMSLARVGGSDGVAEAPVEAESGVDADTVAALPPGSALLTVQRGPNAGARFLLDAARTTAGRRPDSDIFLDDVTVSRKHAEFQRDGDTFRVRDVGSLNGTYVNRDRIDDAVLADGDEVQVGKFRMVFSTGARTPAQGEQGGG